MMKQRFHNLFSPIPRRRGRMLPAIALAAVLCLGGLVSCSSGPQTTLPQEPTDLQALPHLQYTARPGMLIKDAQLTTPFCLSPTDTADASGAPAEQMIPLADAQPLKQGDVVLIVGSIGSHYQVILPALDPPFLEGTLPQSAVSTDPGQFAQANLGTVGAIPRLSPSSQTPAWYPCPPAQAAGPKYRPLAAGPRSGSAPRTSPTISPGPDAPWTSPN